MKNTDSMPSEEQRKRRERLEALSKEEWQEAILNFWKWFEKVRSWDEAHKTSRTRPSKD